jgi:hypothetical protein
LQRVQAQTYLANEARIIPFDFHVLEEQIAVFNLDGRRPGGRRSSLGLAVLSQENRGGLATTY